MECHVRVLFHVAKICFLDRLFPVIKLSVEKLRTFVAVAFCSSSSSKIVWINKQNPKESRKIVRHSWKNGQIFVWILLDGLIEIL